MTKEIIHVIPVGDTMKHTASRRCKCFPVEDKSAPGVWAHNAKDCREVRERVGRHDENKPWRTVHEG